jgi:hypothetical protein
MCFQSQVLPFFLRRTNRYRVTPFSHHYEKLRLCCQGDMTVRRGYVSREGGSGSEGEAGTTWNRNSKRNHCVLMPSYENNCGRMLQVHKTIHAYGTPRRFVHSLQQVLRVVSILLLTRVNTAPYAGTHTALCCWGNVCARDALSRSATMFRGRLLYTTDFKWVHRWTPSGVGSVELKVHPTGPPRTDPSSRQETNLTSGAQYS